MLAADPNDSLCKSTSAAGRDIDEVWPVVPGVSRLIAPARLASQPLSACFRARAAPRVAGQLFGLATDDDWFVGPTVRSRPQSSLSSRGRIHEPRERRVICSVVPGCSPGANWSSLSITLR